MGEDSFNGRYSIIGCAPILSFECEKCGKVLSCIMSIEGQSQIKELIKHESITIDKLSEAYIVNAKLEEFQDGNNTFIKAEALVKCPECYHVNTEKCTVIKNCNENTYKNFD